MYRYQHSGVYTCVITGGVLGNFQRKGGFGSPSRKLCRELLAIIGQNRLGLGETYFLIFSAFLSDHLYHNIIPIYWEKKRKKRAIGGVVPLSPRANMWYWGCRTLHESFSRYLLRNFFSSFFPLLWTFCAPIYNFGS